jgi:hypothetical protein
MLDSPTFPAFKKLLLVVVKGKPTPNCR